MGCSPRTLQVFPLLRGLTTSVGDRPSTLVSVKLTRDHFLSQARLRYILGSLGAVHFGCEQMEWEGDARAGHFFESDGGGSHIAFFWNVTGVVAVAFDDDSLESERNKPRKDRRPATEAPRRPAPERGEARGQGAGSSTGAASPRRTVRSRRDLGCGGSGRRDLRARARRAALVRVEPTR
jgi:hypothetical protein